MTPKEKAQELFKKYYPLVYCFSGSGMLTNTEDETIKVKYAKQCALIAVDEILKCPQTFDTEQVKYSDGTYAREYYEIPNRYWTKVKQEIEKL